MIEPEDRVVWRCLNDACKHEVKQLAHGDLCPKCAGKGFKAVFRAIVPPHGGTGILPPQVRSTTHRPADGKVLIGTVVSHGTAFEVYADKGDHMPGVSGTDQVIVFGPRCRLEVVK